MRERDVFYGQRSLLCAIAGSHFASVVPLLPFAFTYLLNLKQMRCYFPQFCFIGAEDVAYTNFHTFVTLGTGSARRQVTIGSC